MTHDSGFQSGHVLEVLFGAVALVIALLTWFAIKPADLEYLLLIALTFIVVIVAMSIGSWLGSRIPPSSAIAADKASSPYLVGGPSVLLLDVSCEVGGFSEAKIHHRTYRFVLHAITKTKSGELRADIEVTNGTGPLQGGAKTTQKGIARFLMPPSRQFQSEAESIFGFDISHLETRLFVLRVAHINPNAKSVILRACFAYAMPPETELKS